MNGRFSRRSAIFSGAVVAASLLAAPGVVLADRSKMQPRHVAALVIGMGYAEAPVGFRLANTIPDANNIASVLQGIPGATVTLLQDLDLADFKVALDRYLDALAADDIALIYYAGHGVQIDGQNYILSGLAEALIPISDVILRARDKSKTVLIFLDACRNNPFGQAAGESAGAQPLQIARVVKADGPHVNTRSVGLASIPFDSPRLKTNQGLAQFPIRGRGIKIVFSTDPGNVALDGVGDNSNSPFNQSLVRELVKLKSLEDVLADVTRDVVRETGGQQTPWSQGSLDEIVYLAGVPKKYDSGAIQMPIL